MMTRRPRRHKRLLQRFELAILGCALGAGLVACTSVPGETLASGGVRRDVTRRVLAQAAAADPSCRNARISDTEVVEVYPDGKVALERWSVEQCGTRAHYRVAFPAAGKSTPPLVRPE